MRRFVQLALELEQTVRTNRKVSALSSYFQEVDAHDGAWAVRLLTGQRPTKLGASQNLRKLVHEHIGLPDWLMEACRSAVGDSSETWALLFPSVVLTSASEPSFATPPQKSWGVRHSLWLLPAATPCGLRPEIALLD